MFSQMVQNRFPNLPLFLLAHSMGGMVAIKACLDFPHMFAGMVLISPLVIPGKSIGWLDGRITPMRCALNSTSTQKLGFHSIQYREKYGRFARKIVRMYVSG